MKKYLKYLIVMAVFLAAGCAFNAATADKGRVFSGGLRV